MVVAKVANVRATVAVRANLDAASANRLAADADANVRRAAISGQLYSLYPETVSLLTKDVSPAVRKEIAAAPLRFVDVQSLNATLTWPENNIDWRQIGQFGAHRRKQRLLGGIEGNAQLACDLLQTPLLAMFQLKTQPFLRAQTFHSAGELAL
jgi:hypothetical protein